MSLLPRKGILAIAAVVDVALQTVGRPISAKTLATGTACRRGDWSPWSVTGSSKASAVREADTPSPAIAGM
jgi:hypothetical protein